jgi:hypothetical protein
LAGHVPQAWDPSSLCTPPGCCILSDLQLAKLHKDVDVPGGFGVVDEADDVGVVDFVADLHFCFDAFDDVLLQLELGVVIALLFGDLC